MRIQRVFWHYGPGTEPPDLYAFCPLCGTKLTKREAGGRPRPLCGSCGFTQYRNPAPTVSVVVVDGDQVLLGRRREEPGKGTWSLPSGYVEFDDDFLTAAIREVLEETGLRVRLRSILNVVSSFVSPRFHFLGVYLLGDVIGGTLAAGDDLSEVAWFSVGGPLPELGFVEDRIAIDMVLDGADGLVVDSDHAGFQ